MVPENHGDGPPGVAQPALRVTFLIGSCTQSTRDSIEAICALPRIKPVAVLVDTERAPLSRRLRNLRRNINKEGWGYPLRRTLGALRNFTELLAYRTAVPEDDVQNLLRRALPQRFFGISELGNYYGFAVHAVGNLDGAIAVEHLLASKADLGIVQQGGLSIFCRFLSEMSRIFVQRWSIVFEHPVTSASFQRTVVL